MQNISVVFADGPVTSERKTEEQYVLDASGNRVKKYKYFVIEQFVYQIGNQTVKSVEKVINILEKLDPVTNNKGDAPSEFKDPLRKQANKKAGVSILTSQDSDGKELDPSIPPIHPRQSQILKDKTNESRRVIRISESDLRNMINECIKAIINKKAAGFHLRLFSLLS